MEYAPFLAPAVAALAVIVAFVAWRTNLKTLRTSYRPLVRPVPLGKDGDHDFGLNPAKLALKNYGKGSAFRVLLYEDTATFENAEPIAKHDVVEPLGSGQKEQDRIGRIEIRLPQARELQANRRYRLLYQDLEGTFHETQMTVRQGAFEVKFLGPVSKWGMHEAIPETARQLAMLVERE
jgi:hypothetical protein